MDIQSINIIGSGNVAHYLVKMLGSVVRIQSIYSKNQTKAQRLASTCGAVAVTEIAQINPTSHLTILCVKDDAISSLARQIPKNMAVVHTSGAMGIATLEGFEKFGILYPLQSISLNRVDKLQEVPFLIEANSVSFEKELLDFSRRCFSKNSIIVDSKTRLKIHLAAVFANNFSNYFIGKSKEILDQAGVDFRILKPLMVETIEKAFELTPVASQTGPARRGDQKTLELHQSLIEDEKLRKVYEQISTLIQNQNYGNE